jgi:hypothetical protein
MLVSEYNFIEEKIRCKCREEHWYGPSSFKGKERRVSWAHPFSFTSDFAFPPATEQELHETETILGFRFPPLLRALYAHLGNGGFGPGGGIRGVLMGYGSSGTFENESDETILKNHYWREGLVDLKSYANQWRRSLSGDQLLNLPTDVWPQQLAPICDLGCQMEVCVDQEGQEYLWYPSE